MSRVTNAILCMGIHDEPMLEPINRYFGACGFLSLDDDELGHYGGTKKLECTVAVGAFDHLNLDALISHIRGFPWGEDSWAQLIVKEQEDDNFRIIDVVGVVPCRLQG